VHLYSKIKAYSFIPSSTSVVLQTQRQVSYVEFLVRTRYVVYIFCWCRISCRCVRMSNLSDMSGLIEKLNNYNYRDWCSYIKSYLQGQDKCWCSVRRRFRISELNAARMLNSDVSRLSELNFVWWFTKQKDLTFIFIFYVWDRCRILNLTN
jgi:hypothetical protein